MGLRWKSTLFLFTAYTIHWVDGFWPETFDFSNKAGIIDGHENL
jgi:hypothetical protein